jgi:hypothetical protein
MREIACDESGYEGEKFIDTTKDLFAHGSVLHSPGEAADCLAELRRRIKSPASQYGAGHLLREKSRTALEWFLGPGGPMDGRGHVYLIDKRYFLITKLAELFGADPDELYAARPDAYFLSAANDLLRVKDQPGVIDAFFRFGRFPDGRDRAELFREWLLSDPVGNSVLDPLVPAIVAAVRHWGPVTVLHHRQTQLPPRRIARLMELCQGDLGGVGFLDGRQPQIQMADILAGTVRALTADPLALPYIDTSSIRPAAGIRSPDA